MADTTDAKNTTPAQDLLKPLGALAEQETENTNDIEAMLDDLQKRQEAGEDVEKDLQALADMQAESRGAISQGVNKLSNIESAMDRMAKMPKTVVAEQTPVEPQPNPNIIGDFSAAPVQFDISGPPSVEGSTFISIPPVASFTGVTSGDKPPVMDPVTKAWLEELAKMEEERLKKSRQIVDDGPAIDVPQKEQPKAKKPPIDPNAPEASAQEIDEKKLQQSKFATSLKDIDLKGKHFQTFYEQWNVPCLDPELVNCIENAHIKANNKTGGFTINLENGHKVDWVPAGQGGTEFIGMMGKSSKMDDFDAHVIVAAAKTKGWDTINVHGNTEDKEKLWLEAMRQGLKVNGFQPALDSDVRKTWEAEQNETKAGVTAPAKEEPKTEQKAEAAAPTDPATPAPPADAAPAQTPDLADRIMGKAWANKPDVMKDAAPSASSTAAAPSKFTALARVDDKVADRLETLAEKTPSAEDRQSILAVRDSYMAGKLQVEKSTIDKMSSSDGAKIDEGYNQLRSAADKQGMKLPELAPIKAAAAGPDKPMIDALVVGGTADVSIDEMVKRAEQRATAPAEPVHAAAGVSPPKPR